MTDYPKAIQDLLEVFQKLPGVGKRTAERYVFSLVHQPKEFFDVFAQRLLNFSGGIKRCEICGTVSSVTPCPICADPRRNKDLLCIVCTPQNISALEKTADYKGVYHVLGGSLNPLDGITPDQLNMKPLILRLQKNPPKEIILALNLDLSGESTLLYLTKVIKNLHIPNLKLSRLARGLPMGADLDYADAVTLSNSLQKRQDI